MFPDLHRSHHGGAEEQAARPLLRPSCGYGVTLPK